MISMKRVKEARKAPSSSPVVLGDEQPQTIQALQDELKRLQEQLREAEVKAEAYDGLINVAEAKFNILIRKRLAPSGREPACEGSRTAWGSVPLQAVGVSKQAYYKHDESKVLARAAREAFALEYIRGIRSKDPGIGGTKLWHMYRRDFQGNNSVGRDCFAYIINRHDLKVRQKVRKPRTADSSHGFPHTPISSGTLFPPAPTSCGQVALHISLSGRMRAITRSAICRSSWMLIQRDCRLEFGSTLEATYPVEVLKPKSVIRLAGAFPVAEWCFRVSCPLLSASCFSLRLDVARYAFG